MKLRAFQTEDLARLALVDGAILAWDTGLGKTWAMFLWPFLKCGYTVDGAGRLTPRQPVLLLVPGDLHQKTIEAGRDIFRTTVTPLTNQHTFLSLLQPAQGPLAPMQLPNGFYITSYTQLGVNGVDEPLSIAKHGIAQVRELLGISDADLHDYFARRGEHYRSSYELLASHPGDTYMTIQRRRMAMAEDGDAVSVGEAFMNIADFHTDRPVNHLCQLPRENQARILERYIQVHIAESYAGDGERKTHSGPKCVSSPTLADLATGCFHSLVIDEGVRIKGEHTAIGIAARQLRTKCCLILSATPIKNRLPDIFRLAWLAAGGHADATARFPYSDSSRDRDDFAENFCVSERNITKEAETERRWRKLTPQVCNVHQVWKLFGPLILRRRKKDIGHEMVKKTKHIIRVPMGKMQAAVYRYHMEADYLDKHGRPAIGAQLQALRAAAAAPTSESLQPVNRDSNLPFQSAHSFTPKVAAILRLTHQVMARREQIIIFSSLHEPLDILSSKLTEAGIRHVKLDGRVTQARRGKASAQFRKGPPAGDFDVARINDHIPVMLASSECMAEGHDWPKANNVVLADYPWAMDKVLQSVDRAYRLNSERDLNCWHLVTEGTIERRMESMCDEKSDASELVLDGHLLGETPTEMNLAELLKRAAADFDPETKTIDEIRLKDEWPSLRESLRSVQTSWDYGVAATPLPESQLSPCQHSATPALAKPQMVTIPTSPASMPTNVIPLPIPVPQKPNLNPMRRVRQTAFI